MPPEAAAEDLYIGIDLGGTKTLAIAATAGGTVLGEATLPTPAAEDAGPVVTVIADTVGLALAQAGGPGLKVRGAGIAAAGAIDGQRGVVVHAPQLPRWHDVPLVALVRDAVGIDAVIGNDANLAALSEQRYGVARGVASVLYVTVSTGIGGGIVLDGQLHTGAHGFAGEVGHISVDAHGPYGRSSVPGAVESLASGTALARIASERMAQGAPSSMSGVPGTLTAQDVFAAFHAGDELARAVVHEGIHYLGIGLTTMVNILDPGMVVIGGGLSNEWDAYIAPAVALMRERSFAGMGKDTPVVPPALGVKAGALGAIALAVDAFRPDR